ncbi:MAG TPA: hypothetical protein VK797_26535 [Tepidisphaeraceae bacterium]|nr:hypothetical protein [Tepidisphaeraceae bacterium]
MTTEQLRNFHRAQPFVPFEIHVADGRKFRVNHSELLAYAPGARTFAVWSDGVYEVVDLLLVASLRPMNGEGRRGGQRRR